MEATKYGKCQEKVGIFHVRECRNKAVIKCQKCGKSLCDEHKVYLGVHVFCPACAADVTSKDKYYKAHPEMIPKKVWYHNSRIRIYQVVGFEPFIAAEFLDFETSRFGDYANFDNAEEYFDS